MQAGRVSMNLAMTKCQRLLPNSIYALTAVRSCAKEENGEQHVTKKQKALSTLPRWPMSDEPLRVALVTTPDAQPLDIAGPHEIFSLAKKKLRELGNERAHGYEVEVFNIGRGRVITGESGLSFLAKGSYQSLREPIDTLLIAGGMEPWDPSGKGAVLDWVRRWAPRVRRIGSICTGAFVLAAAGLLDGRRATTHWYFCHQLAREYPAVRVDSEPIFVRDGNLLTSAGVTAGMDMSLALVEEDFGSEVALRIARAYVMFLRRPGGQSQFSTPLSFTASSESPLNKLQVWILEHLQEILPVERLASRVNMSARNFARVFAREFGMSPGEYLVRVRVEAARKRLEESNQGVDRIAAEIGFGSSESMRRAFIRTLGVNPNDYRARFKVGRSSKN
jgi:transcriptional regulator GlxA family with amidase domain